MPPEGERRVRGRLALRWPVCLTRQETGEPIHVKTENLSSQGFYCLCAEPFAVGEQLDCRLVIPWQKRRYGRPNLVLACRVRVVRVETEAAGDLFGVAFQIENYSVVTASSLANQNGE